LDTVTVMGTGDRAGTRGVDSHISPAISKSSNCPDSPLKTSVEGMRVHWRAAYTAQDEASSGLPFISKIYEASEGGGGGRARE
jgi:hypothetical protein